MALINIGIDLGGRYLQTAFRGVAMAIGEVTFIETAEGNSFVQRNDGEVQTVVYVYQGVETVIYNSSDQDDNTTVQMPVDFGVVTSVDVNAAAYGAISRDAHEKKYTFDEDFGRHEVGADVTSPYGGDFNDYRSAGLYYFENLTGYANVPGGIFNGWLSVMTNKLRAIKQVFYRQGSENTQADVYTRVFTNGAWTSWRRLVTENELYYMPGDQTGLRINCGGLMSTNRTYIGGFIPLTKPVHSSVKSVTVVNNSNYKVTIRQNGQYLVNDVNPVSLRANCPIRANGLELNLTKTSGFGGTNNDSVSIVGYIMVKFN